MFSLRVKIERFLFRQVKIGSRVNIGLLIWLFSLLAHIETRFARAFRVNFVISYYYKKLIKWLTYETVLLSDGGG